MTQIYTTAIDAAIKAGEAIMEIYKQDFEVFTKEDQSPLTLADTKAHDIIVEFLKSTNIPVLSEESSDLSYDSRKNWERYWLVDPLDGTKEFVKRNGEFTVNIALIENHDPVFGVIYAPVMKELFIGDVQEQKTYKILVDSEFQSKELDTKAALLDAKSKNPNFVRIVASRSHLNDATKSFLESLKIETHQQKELVSKGSSLKFCLVAEGKADIYPRLAPTMEWDTAAGQAICNAVGLEVLEMETKTPLKYNKENLMNPYFIVQ